MLDHPPRHQALPAKAGILPSAEAVEFERGIALFGQIEHLRRFALHAEGRLERADAGLQRLVDAALALMLAVGLFQQFQLQLLQPAGRGSRRHVGDRRGAGKHLRPLVASRQEVGPPGLCAGIGRKRRDHHERRQVLILSPQAVADPRAHAGPGKSERAGVHAQRGFVMIGMVRRHRADHAQVVDHAADVGKEVAHLDARLAVRLELPLRCLEIELVRTALPLPVVDSQLFAMIGKQLGLGIERVDVRYAAGHVQENDILGFGRKMGLLGSQRIERSRRRGVFRSRQITKNACQRDRAKASRGLAQHLAAIHQAVYATHHALPTNQSTYKNSLLVMITRQ